MGVAAWWSAPAWACAVCQGGNNANQGAYLDMTIFLSLLPLAFIGGVAWFIWRMSGGEAEPEAATSAPSKD